jgi:hypothetical protein
MASIARRLNLENIPYKRKPNWNAATITRTLKQAKYIGIQVWGRTIQFLAGPRKAAPREHWVTYPHACEPIIDEELFQLAQKRFSDFPHNLTDEELINRLRLVLETHGRLTRGLIRQSPYCPSESTYRDRFGNLLDLFGQLGFHNPEYLASSTSRSRLMVIRRNLIKEILAQFPDELLEVRQNYRFRALLKYRKTGLLISIMLARYVHTSAGKPRWLIRFIKNERKRVTILALLNENNTSIKELRVFRKIRMRTGSTQVEANNQWLQSGLPLKQLSELMQIVHPVQDI